MRHNSWNKPGHCLEVSALLSGPDVPARICKAVFSVQDQAGESPRWGLEVKLPRLLVQPRRLISARPKRLQSQWLPWEKWTLEESELHPSLKPRSSHRLLHLQWAESTNLGAQDQKPSSSSASTDSLCYFGQTS